MPELWEQNKSSGLLKIEKPRFLRCQRREWFYGRLQSSKHTGVRVVERPDGRNLPLQRLLNSPCYGAGRNAGACVAGGKPDKPFRRSCWHTLPSLLCLASMSATTGSLHPDIVRARNIPVANTNNFPTTKPYVIFISLSNIKGRDLGGFRQATSPSGIAVTHLPKGIGQSVHIPHVLGGKALHPQGLSIPPTVRFLILSLYPLDRKSQVKSDPGSKASCSAAWIKIAPKPPPSPRRKRLSDGPT